MKSLEELAKIRERMNNKVALREGENNIRIVVGMATCGIAAGARPVMQKFLEENEQMLSQKVVTYAVLGKQEEIVPELSKFGFTTVNQSVMRFDFQDENAVNTLREKSLPRLNNGFAISLWDDKYFNSAAELIHNSFRKMSDAKFDPRFNSLEGTKQILKEISFLLSNTTV